MYVLGVYGIMIGGNSKFVYCFFENGLLWIVSFIIIVN